MLEAYTERWALVTGASSGIGAEFARVLAGNGMHLVLTARRGDLLEELAQELQQQHMVQTLVVVEDLSSPGAVTRILERIESQDITLELLVNNAGFGFVGEVTETDVDLMLSMVQLNISALTELTYRVLPGLLQLGHGAIINVASVVAMQPVAYMPVYSASKAFVLHFSEALWAEARDHGVTVMALCPGTTQTEFFDVAGVPGWLKKQKSQTAREVVKEALRGLERRRSYLVTGLWNYVRSLGARLATRKTVVTQTMKFFRPRLTEDPDES
ncbi:MAG: SDR family oxidoreductase [Planctomycetota bacterium]|nr:SDR family oxidoreductase [Planctomycetota bacterium]